MFSSVCKIAISEALKDVNFDKAAVDAVTKKKLREGLRNKIKKKYGIFHTFLTPPLRWGKVWNLFMILFNIQGSNLRCFLMHFTTVGIGKNGV